MNQTPKLLSPERLAEIHDILITYAPSLRVGYAVSDLLAHIATLNDALEFYADLLSYMYDVNGETQDWKQTPVLIDSGSRARRALNKESQ